MKMVENQFDRKIKCLKSDNGTEIKNANTQKFLEELGIFHTRSNAYTPQQNGRIEREMRTVVELARSAIHAQDLNEILWAEAVNYAVFTLNQTGTSSLKDKSPVELWFGRRVDVRKLRSFGCKCYVLIQDHKRAKTEKKSKKGIFVGYDLDSPCYRIYLSEEGDIVSSDNVIFYEKLGIEKGCTEIEVPLAESRNESSRKESESSEPEISNSEDSNNDQPPHNLDHHASDDSDESDDSDDSTVSSEQNQPASLNLRDRRTLKKPVKYRDYTMGYLRGGNKANVTMIEEFEDISVSED